MTGASKRWIILEIGIDGDPELIDFRIRDTARLKDDVLAAGVASRDAGAIDVYKICLERARAEGKPLSVILWCNCSL